MVLLKRISFIAVLFSLISVGGALGQLDQHVKLGQFSQSARLTLVFPSMSQFVQMVRINNGSTNYLDMNVGIQGNQTSFPTDRLIQYFASSDSVKTTSAIYNSLRARRAVKIGLWVGGASYIAGLGGTYLALGAPPNNVGCGLGCIVSLVVIPATVGVLGSLGGSVYGYVTGKSLEGQFINYPTSKRPLSNIGFGLKTNRGHASERLIRIIYRSLAKKTYLPNRYVLKVGEQFGWHDYALPESNTGAENSISHTIRTFKLGADVTRLNNNRVIGLIYGLGFGSVWGTRQQRQVEDGVRIPEVQGTLWSPYAELIIGMNVNLLSWLSLDVTYNHELYGLYKKFQLQYGAEPKLNFRYGAGLSLYW